MKFRLTKNIILFILNPTHGSTKMTGKKKETNFLYLITVTIRISMNLQTNG